MPEDDHRSHLPYSAALRWLVDPGSSIPAEIREQLLSQLFANPIVIIMGSLTSVLLSGAALAMHCGSVFAFYMTADIVCTATRVFVMKAWKRAPNTDRRRLLTAYLVLGVLWVALQGAIAFTALRTDQTALEILSTIQIFGLIGPVCSRNYPVPRYCFVLVLLLDLPFVFGCVLFGTHWLLITLPETPPFLFAAYRVTKHFQLLAASSMQAELESQQRAMRDPLTGLFNRRALAHAIERDRRLGAACATVIALDLDRFKDVNDRFGHHVGDALLTAVADRLIARIRRPDLIVRLGGDEFVIIIQDAPATSMAELCDRIIKDITETPYLIEGTPAITVGASIGFACAPADGTDIETLHRRADSALYAAKASGRGVHRRYLRATGEDADPASWRGANVANKLAASGSVDSGT